MRRGSQALKTEFAGLADYHSGSRGRVLPLKRLRQADRSRSVADIPTADARRAAVRVGLTARRPPLRARPEPGTGTPLVRQRQVRALGLPIWPQALRACGRAAARTAAGRVLTPVCVAGVAWDGARGAALASGWR